MGVERKAKEQEERKAKEEVERKALEEEGARKAKEEAERKTEEAEERKAREEAERRAREELEKGACGFAGCWKKTGTENMATISSDGCVLILAGEARNVSVAGSEITLGEFRGWIENNRIVWSNGSTWERAQAKEAKKEAEKEAKRRHFQKLAAEFRKLGGKSGNTDWRDLEDLDDIGVNVEAWLEETRLKRERGEADSDSDG